MADSVAGRFQLIAEFFESDDDANRGGALRHAIDLALNIGNGTSDGQIDLIYSAKTTIAASATTVFDLAGVLADAVGGDTITMAEVSCILLVNHSTTSGDDLQIGPDATGGCVCFWANASDRNICAAGITGQPGIVFLYAPRGYAVTGGATDEIAVIEVGGANTVTYSIFLLGRSA